MPTHISSPNVWLLAIGSVGLLVVLYTLRRAFLALATLRATAWMPMLSRRLSGWFRTRDYGEDELSRADGANEQLARRRQDALDRLVDSLGARYAESTAWGNAVRLGFSDLRFTDASRVPFPFARVMRQKVNLCSVVTASNGPYLQNLDGHWTLDVSGSYGLNVAGFDRYKHWIEQGWQRVKDLGPVLGPVHPVVAENIDLLKRVSHLDEVSFHMSGTEAVMAAVRMARFSTRRPLIVCFSGAYHGWWDGVQPGLGSERPLDDCLTLKDVSQASLALIRRRAGEIAGVLVNPVQAFHPNTPPPNDAVLLTSDVRRADGSVDTYAAWLKQLQDVCRRCSIPLIFDEVYTGFRLAPGGAQEYFDVRADMVVYGKTVGGGMPIGVVCGSRALMCRFDPKHPMRMAYVVGTFSAHPLVMGAMNEFLRWLLQPDTAALYAEANQRCAVWVHATNRALADDALPIRLVNLGTVWTVLFKEPSRYNWLLQYYLRAEGLTLSWVGTGRCLSSFDFTDEDYRDLRMKIVNAGRAMSRDGWWPTVEEFPEREHRMRMRLAGDMLTSLVPVPAAVRSFYEAVKQRKHDDHHASHNNWMNQYLHLMSSSAFIYCYAIAASNLTRAMFLGLAALFVRQFGHAVLEPACHDQEARLLGFTTRSKSLIVLGYVLIPAILMSQAGTWSLAAFVGMADAIALQWFRWTLAVVFGRVLFLACKYDFRTALIWFVKLVTDPFTDVVAYFPRRLARA